MATVLMIDLSHSMVLYGEDRITPARKTAMALSELILTRYPKDTLDIVAFGNEAWEVSIKDLPYPQCGAILHQHACWIAAGKGYIAPAEESEQTNLYDYRWQAQLPYREREDVSQCFWAGPPDCE